MAIDWFRGGPEFQAARINSGRDLAGYGGIGTAIGGGIRALQRAVQSEKALKAQEAMLDEQLGGGMEPAAPEPAAPLDAAGEAGGMPEPAPVEAGVTAPEDTGGFMGALGRMGGGLARGAGALGRMAVGLPTEPGLTERVGRMQGQLAAEQEANKARIARMEALARIGGRNPEMLGAIHRAMPEQFPEFPEAAAGAEPPGNPSEYAGTLAQRYAEEARGPGAQPTAQEMQRAVDAVRHSFPAPVQPKYEKLRPVYDQFGNIIGYEKDVLPGYRPPKPEQPAIPDASSAGADFWNPE